MTELKAMSHAEVLDTARSRLCTINEDSTNGKFYRGVIAIATAQPVIPEQRQMVPDEIMPGGLVYSSPLTRFESNDSDKVAGYHCLVHGKTRSVMNQEQAYSDAMLVVEACRAAFVSTAQPASEPKAEGDFLSRLKAEHVELCDKTEKLDDFIFQNPAFLKLTPRMQRLLESQIVVMTEYVQILECRIELIEAPAQESE